MKPGLLLTFIFSAFLFPAKADGQSDYDTGKDSLDYFFQNRELITLFTKIEFLAEEAGKAKNKIRLDSLGKYLLRDYRDLSPKESRAIRKAGMVVGFIYKRYFSDFQNSLTYYLLAHQYAPDKEVLDDLAWNIENDISNIYTRFGDYDKAEYFSKLVEKSLEHLIQSDSPANPHIERLARFYTNRGIQRKSEGKNEEAFRYFNKGFLLADSIKFRAGTYPNALGLTEFYMDNNNLSLSQHYLEIAKNTIQVFNEASNYKERKAELLFQEAQFINKKGLLEKSNTLIHQSISQYKSAIDTLGEYYNFKKGREFSKYYIPLAKAYFELDSFKEAGDAINRGLSSIIADYNSFENLPEPGQLYRENSFNELFKLQSQLFLKQYGLFGDTRYLEKALQSIELALKANDIIRDEVIADPSKLIAIRENKIMTHEGLKIIYILYSLNGGKQYLEKARDLFNRSKSLLLDEKIRRHRLADQMSDEDSTALAQLQWDIHDLHTKQFKEGINIDSLNRLILDYQEQIKGLFNLYKGVQLVSEQRKDYIEYSIHEEDIYVLSSINGAKQFFKLGSKSDFMKLLERMNDFIVLRGLSEDSTIQNDLYQFLIAPVSLNLPESLVIIPDGEIGFVPFDMLKDQERKLLIAYCLISYAYEYEFYKTEGEKLNRKFEIYCLAPTYKGSDRKREEVTRGSLFQLPYAKAEADSIRRLFGTRALISENGNKDNMIAGVQQATIFHFAGHAIVNHDKAYLAFNSDGDEQMQMTDQEIALLSGSAHLVVLSACETGLGKLEIGEGIRSLGRSFIESGASSTIISLWNVNDKSTSMIMTAFYKFLLQGLAKDEALRKAKLEYISTVKRKYQHPYFWAAFIPAGDMNPMKIY